MNQLFFTDKISRTPKAKPEIPLENEKSHSLNFECFLMYCFSNYIKINNFKWSIISNIHPRILPPIYELRPPARNILNYLKLEFGLSSIKSAKILHRNQKPSFQVLRMSEKHLENVTSDRTLPLYFAIMGASAGWRFPKGPDLLPFRGAPPSKKNFLRDCSLLQSYMDIWQTPTHTHSLGYTPRKTFRNYL